MIYHKEIVAEINRFNNGHFQNTPNIKRFFGYVEAYQILEGPFIYANECNEGLIIFFPSEIFLAWTINSSSHTLS